MSNESHNQRVQDLMRQALAPASDGGVVALWRCNVCGLPWLADGPHAYLRLDGEELAQAVKRTHADLAALPYATCRLCGLQGVGEINIDEYGKGQGYGLSWEGAPPIYPHMLITAVSQAYLETSARRGQEPRAGVVTQFPRCRACITDLAHVDTRAFLQRVSPFTLAECAGMAEMNPPALDASDTTRWRWHGLHWRGLFPAIAMNTPTVITIAQALPITEPFSQSLMIDAMRAICAVVLAGRIGGEAPDA